MNKSFDAIVVGAGPAGGSAAVFLSCAGLHVAVVEKSAFPRRKVCGEFVSAATLPLLDAVGIGEAARAAGGPPVTRVGIYGGTTTVTAPMPMPASGARDPGRTIRRDALDTLLLEAAARAGAEVFQPYRATDLRSDETGHVLTMRGEDEIALSAPVLVAAHGSWEPGTLPTQKKPPHRDSDLLAFKAYLFGATFDRDLMILAGFPGGYAGMVHRDAGSVGISACFRRRDLARAREAFPAATAGESVFRFMAAATRGIAEAMNGAEFESPPYGSGPLVPGIRPGYEGGIFRVGNAAGEAHPAIADGLSMAIQSGALLASHLSGASLDRPSLDRIGAAYASAWRAQFAVRLRVADLYARACMNPGAHLALAPLLSTFPGLLTFGAALSGKTKPLKFELSRAV